MTARFQARRKALGVSGPSAIALAQAIGSLARGPLPGPQDGEAMMPPVAIYWFRRVPDFNLWIWFAFDDDRVTIVSVSSNPPIPIDR